jgi:hypothetical protein
LAIQILYWKAKTPNKDFLKEQRYVAVLEKLRVTWVVKFFAFVEPEGSLS